MWAVDVKGYKYVLEAMVGLNLVWWAYRELVGSRKYFWKAVSQFILSRSRLKFVSRILIDSSELERMRENSCMMETSIGVLCCNRCWKDSREIDREVVPSWRSSGVDGDSRERVTCCWIWLIVEVKSDVSRMWSDRRIGNCEKLWGVRRDVNHKVIYNHYYAQHHLYPHALYHHFF